MFNSQHLISGASILALTLGSQLVMPTSAKAQVQDSYAIRACSNYLKAGYMQGRLLRARHYGNNYVACDTSVACYGIQPQHSFYWYSRP